MRGLHEDLAARGAGRRADRDTVVLREVDARDGGLRVRGRRQFARDEDLQDRGCEHDRELLHAHRPALQRDTVREAGVHR